MPANGFAAKEAERLFERYSFLVVVFSRGRLREQRFEMVKIDGDRVAVEEVAVVFAA